MCGVGWKVEGAGGVEITTGVPVVWRVLGAECMGFGFGCFPGLQDLWLREEERGGKRKSGGRDLSLKTAIIIVQRGT